MPYKQISAKDILHYAEMVVQNNSSETHSAIVVVDQRNPINQKERESAELIKRGASFTKGAMRLIENLPLSAMYSTDAGFDQQKRETLKTNIRSAYQAYKKQIQSMQSMEEGKKYFDEFLATIAILMKSQTVLSFNTIKNYLNTAERLQVWNEGRKPLITVSQHGDKTVVQAEIPELQLTEQQINEYLQLANSTNPADYPEWFMSMPVWEQRYMKKKLEGATRENIRDILLTIPSSTRYVPGLANYTRHVMRVYQTITDPTTNKKSHVLIQDSQRDRSAVIAPIDLTSSKQEKERQRITEGNVAQLLLASLGDRAESYTANWSQGNTRLGQEAENAIPMPVTVQTLLSPGIVTSTIANLLCPSDNNAKMVKNKKIALKKFRDALENPSATESKAFFAANGLEVEHGAVKVKSGNGKTFWVRPNIINLNNPLNIFRKLPTVKRFIKNIFTSHVSENDRNAIMLLNSAGYFIGNAINHYDASNRNTSYLNVLKAGLTTLSPNNALTNVKRVELVKRLKNAIADIKSYPADSKNTNLVMLLMALRDYIETPTMKEQDRHRPLVLSSLEQIITDLSGGVGYGSCKSGKDRKGIEVLHTDAMLLYFTTYGELPRYDDTKEKRDNFNSMFTDLFNTNHQQEAASQNAPGASGIKELKFILPKDLQNAIGAEALAKSNAYGGLNKVDYKVEGKLLRKVVEEYGIQPTKSRIQQAKSRVGQFFKFVDKTIENVSQGVKLRLTRKVDETD